MFEKIILLYSEHLNEILKRRGIDPNNKIGQIYLKTLNNSVYEQILTKRINVDGKSPEDIVNEIISQYLNRKS